MKKILLIFICLPSIGFGQCDFIKLQDKDSAAVLSRLPLDSNNIIIKTLNPTVIYAYHGPIKE